MHQIFSNLKGFFLSFFNAKGDPLAFRSLYVSDAMSGFGTGHGNSGGDGSYRAGCVYGDSCGGGFVEPQNNFLIEESDV